MARAGDFRVGVAALDITPPLGIPLAGYYHARGADGVLDPLFTKALVLEAHGTRSTCHAHAMQVPFTLLPHRTAVSSEFAARHRRDAIALAQRGPTIGERQGWIAWTHRPVLP